MRKSAAEVAIEAKKRRQAKAELLAKSMPKGIALSAHKLPRIPDTKEEKSSGGGSGIGNLLEVLSGGGGKKATTKKTNGKKTSTKKTPVKKKTTKDSTGKDSTGSDDWVDDWDDTGGDTWVDTGGDGWVDDWDDSGGSSWSWDDTGWKHGGRIKKAKKAKAEARKPRSRPAIRGRRRELKGS